MRFSAIGFPYAELARSTTGLKFSHVQSLVIATLPVLLATATPFLFIVTLGVEFVRLDGKGTMFMTGPLLFAWNVQFLLLPMVMEMVAAFLTNAHAKTASAG